MNSGSQSLPHTTNGQGKELYFIQTTDVEMTSVNPYNPSPERARQVLAIGLPKLLDLYEEYGVRGTFFFTGKIVEFEPRVVHIVRERGHEVGCHGYTHYSSEGFDTMPYEKQVDYLVRSKRLIEREAGEIVSFRSPELRIGRDTVRALDEAGFEIDSSVSSQRFDGPFSYGTLNKLNWLSAPRAPYLLSHKSPFRPGGSRIFEIPVSALVAPYIGTFMRIAPGAFSLLERILFAEARVRGQPLVFLFHPDECMDETLNVKCSLKDGVLVYLREGVRQQWKTKNLGDEALRLMGKTLGKARRRGFRFVSLREYRDICLERNRG